MERTERLEDVEREEHLAKVRRRRDILNKLATMLGSDRPASLEDLGHAILEAIPKDQLAAMITPYVVDIVTALEEGRRHVR